MKILNLSSHLSQSFPHSCIDENFKIDLPVTAGSLVPASIHIVTAPEHDRDEHCGADHVGEDSQSFS